MSKVKMINVTLIPGIAMQVTTYQIMKDLGFLNSIVGYMILMSGTDVISIYIFLQYFENLDGALDESAVLEKNRKAKAFWLTG